MKEWGAIGCLLAILLSLPRAGTAQGWLVDASAGAAEYEAVAGEVASVNAILGVRREGPTWFTLAAGLPLDSAAVPWAVGGIGSRWSLPLGGAEVGFDGSTVGFGYRVGEPEMTGGGATLIGLPFLAYSHALARVELRTGVLHHSSFFDGQTTSRTVHDSGVRALVGLSPGLSILAEGRLVRAPEANYPFTGATLELVGGPVGAWIRGGRWMADELDAMGWGVGGTLSLPGRLAVRAAYERDTDDPLYWNGARNSWSIGISRALGRRTALGVSLPAPESFRIEAGTVVLSVSADDVQPAPSVAGDFTGWQPVPMQLRDGAWEARFVLAPGIYHFSYQRADGSWFLPDSVHNRVDDGFGGVNGVLVVVEP